MAYLKPQSPLQHKNGDYFYPLTTVDQVVMEDGSRLNSVFKHTVKTNATLLASNWSNEAPYTQTITLDDNIDTELNVDVNIAYSGVKETDEALISASGCLTYIKKNENNIIFYCLKKKPEIDIPIEIEGSCRNSIGSVNVIDGLKPNFEIVKYETEEELLADTPKENTIGIVTDTEIASWNFSAAEPESPQEGMVWILVDQRISTVGFNALKKNGIQVYPFQAKQYIGDAWVEKTAKSYQGGEWVDWWDGTLYDAGDEYEAITGGWEISDMRWSNGYPYAAPNVTKEGNTIKLVNGMSNDGAGSITHKNALNLSSYNTVKINVTEISGECRENLAVMPEGYTFINENAVVSLNDQQKAGLKTLDISNIDKSKRYFIVIATSAGTNGPGYIAFDKVWLE